MTADSEFMMCEQLYTGDRLVIRKSDIVVIQSTAHPISANVKVVRVYLRNGGILEVDPNSINIDDM